MNISKFTLKLALASLAFSAVQGPVLLAMESNLPGLNNTVNQLQGEVPAPTDVVAPAPTEVPVPTDVVEKVVSEAIETVKELPIDEVVQGTQEAIQDITTEIPEEVKEETKKLVDKILEYRIVNGPASFLRDGINGFAEGSTKLVYSVTPESTLAKIGAVTAVVTVVGGIAGVTYYFSDKTYVKATLGALKSFVTSKKVWVALGLTALTTGYIYETSDWKNPLYSAVGLGVVYGLWTAVSWGWNKFTGGSKVLSSVVVENKATYEKLLELINYGLISPKSVSCRTIWQIRRTNLSDEFLANDLLTESQVTEFQNAIQASKQNNNRPTEALESIQGVMKAKLEAAIAQI